MMYTYRMTEEERKLLSKLGRMGAKKRQEATTPKQRSDSASKAAKARWAAHRATKQLEN